MSGKKMKHPSSARRHIKKETFSSFVSGARLRHVQSLLGEDPESSSPDALLAVLGVDSRYNEGMEEFANFLLFDFFTSRRSELESSGFDQEVIEDMVFLVRRDSVDVYCNPVNYHYLLPYIAHWRNLTIHCISEQHHEDEEKVEEFKIKSFISMLAHSSKVGIPYFRSGERGKFDKMTLEKWPLVQAFALDDFGGGGFFTMKYEVIDMSDYLQSLYHLLDPVSLETMFTQHLPLFERQWFAMMENVSVQRKLEKKTMTESSVSEPLTSFFSHGRVTGEVSKIQGPFVLFGTNSCKDKLKKVGVDGNVSSDTIYKTGLNKQSALHMVCQAVAPRTSLRCTRTYFFQTGILPHPLTLSDDVADVYQKSDIRLLISLYKACIIAVLEGIRVYSATLDPDQAGDEACSVLLEQCEEDSVPVKQAWLNKQSLVLRAGKNIALAKTASLTLADVPSVEHLGQTLGSVVFGECFIESVIYTKQNDGREDINGSYMLLTRNIPYFTTWPLLGDSFSRACSVEKLLTKPAIDLLGKKLTSSDNIHLMVDGGTPLDAVLNGYVYFYEDGVVFYHEHLGHVVLPKSALSSIQFYDGDSSSYVALFIMTYADSFTPFIPIQLRTPEQRLILPVLPKTRCQQDIYAKILPTWRREGKTPVVEMLKRLPADLTNLHEQTQAACDAASKPLTSVSQLTKARSLFPGLDAFFRHFLASNVGHQIIPQRHLEAVLNQEYDEGGFQDDPKIVLRIIGGVAGSHHDNLYQAVSKVISGQSNWAVVRQGMDKPQRFSGEDFVQSLSAVYGKLSGSSSGRDCHALVMLPGFTDITEVIKAIVTSKIHPKLAKATRIGSMTICVNSDNSCTSDLYLLPGLLNQCAQGWVNNIVYTSPAVKTSLTVQQEKMQDLLKAINQDVSFMVAPEGHVTRSSDLDAILSDTAFNTGPLLQARYLNTPGWETGVLPSPRKSHLVDEVILKFSQPLDKSRLMSRLKGLYASSSHSAASHKILHIRGRFPFTGGHALHELHYSVVSDHLSLTNAAGHTAKQAEEEGSYFVAFMGCSLNKRKLKEWLQECAAKKPERKVRRVMANLTKTEINRVTKEHHLDPLPEGWFYNGNQYVCLTGEKSSSHPETERHLTEYLDKINQEVDKYNLGLDKQPYTPLFD